MATEALPDTQLSPEYFRALLNGLARKNFHGDESITNDVSIVSWSATMSKNLF